MDLQTKKGSERDATSANLPKVLLFSEILQAEPGVSMSLVLNVSAS